MILAISIKDLMYREASQRAAAQRSSSGRADQQWQT